jgi:hypothetical protein
VAGCIIAKLPSSWRNFASSLKHKRQKISVKNLIASLDVEKKARAKDNIEKGTRKKLAYTSSRETMARTRKSLSNLLSMLNKILHLRRRRKTKQSYLALRVESLVILLKIVRSERTRKRKKVNPVTASSADDGYGNFPTILSVFQFPSWWVDTGANIHVCADISLFSSYQGLQGSAVLMGNGSHASVHGVSMVDLKFTLGNIVQLKNVQHVPTIRKNLVSVSLLLRDGF